MDLQEALKLKKVKIHEHDGFDLTPGEAGRRVKKWRVIGRDATPEDILSWDPIKGVIVTKDGQKIKIYE